MLHIEGVCRNYNIFIFISGAKNSNCYDIKSVHHCNVKIWILIKISVDENVGRVGIDLHLQTVHVPCSYYCY